MIFRFFFIFLSFCILPGCAETELVSNVIKRLPNTQNEDAGSFKVGNPYKIDGKWYQPEESYDYEETGIASWYGSEFAGKRTANGEIFDKNELTAAHRTLQMPSFVRVTNLENGRSVVVRVNDRGPFKRGRVMDVSSKAADLLGFKGKGTAKVKLQVLTEESKQLAQAAMRGEDTRGMEMALNQGRQPVYQTASVSAESATTAQQPSFQTASLGSVDREALPPLPMPAHLTRGQMYPDPVVINMPVKPSTIYVQVGSFTNPQNAARLADKLQGYGNVRVAEAFVQGRKFYRVRVPSSDVDSADLLLDKLVREAGQSKAILIVD